jgi:hypothetical protein
VEERAVPQSRVPAEGEHLELGDRWGKGAPRYTTAQVVEWSKGVVKQGGAITWDTPLDATGKVAEAFLERLGKRSGS